jgi:hypothetical protein
MATPAPLTPEEFEVWHRENIDRLEALHKKHMAEWEYLRSPEFARKVRQDIIDATHEPIQPPWEE